MSFNGLGNGTIDDPYQIKTLKHLNSVNEEPDAHYILMNNIDASDTKYWHSGEGFEPIGTFHPVLMWKKFTGSFDGQHYVISGLYINRPDDDWIGLFGYIEGDDCIIKNVCVEDCEIIGRDYVGGLVGKNQCTILNSHVTGSIKGEEEVGGLVGRNDDGIIHKSYANVTVQGAYVGGLIGRMSGGEIYDCYAVGSVYGTNRAGGLCSFCDYGMFYNCFAAVEVTGDYYLDTLSGGGILNKSENCFCDVDVCGFANGSSFEKTTEEMKTKSTFVDAEWDFDNIWGMDPNINDGYPNLEKSKVVSVNNFTAFNTQANIRIFPNPAFNNVTLQININKSSRYSSLAVYSLNSELIMKEFDNLLLKGSNEIPLSFKGLSKGSYFCVLTINGKRFVKKINLVK